MGGKSSPPPPDYSGLQALGQEQLAFAKQQYADILPFAKQVYGQQMDAQKQQMQQAQDYYNYQQQTFRPLERGLVADAQRFSTENYREQLAKDAALQAARAFDQTQGMADRASAARGIAVDSPAAMALRNRGQYALATGTAQGMNQARTQADQLGWARRMDVTGLGRNLAGASTAAYSGATGAGTSGINTAMAPGNQYMQGLQQAGGTMSAVTGQQAGMYNAAMQQSDPIMGLIGTGIGAYGAFKSDRRLKQNIEVVGRDERTMLPLYEFEYKNGTGKRFLGVMADDVEQKYPEAVFTMPDGYKAVNYAMLGIEMIEVAHG